MPRYGEVISLQVGQAGCQLGEACWQMYCLEHGIEPDGTISSKFERAYPEKFFKTTESGKMVPRSAFVDLEPSIIDNIRVGKFGTLFDPQMFISNKEDAANCFARGFITLAKDVIEPINNCISSLTNDCERLQGFLLFRAYGGGTGSGLGSRIAERLHEEYPKCDVFEFCIYPAPRLSPIILEPYNTALAIHESAGFTDASLIMENEACYDICSRLLDISSPVYSNINRVICQIASSLTASFRFSGTLNVNLKDLTTNLILFPRLQYPVISYAPFITKKQAMYQNITPKYLLNECFKAYNQLVKCDTQTGKYMACTILFRGDVSNSSICEAAYHIKTKKKINFVEWYPTMFKFGVNETPPVVLPNEGLAQMDRACLTLANCTAIRSVWAKVCRKFDLMYAKKAFLHWYIGEGLEESDFEETRLDLAALENDYSKAEFD